MNNKINIYSGINSIGIPYTPDNKENIGYLDIISNYFSESGYVVSSFNLSNIAKNRTWDLEKIFKQNKKYKIVKKEQFLALKIVGRVNKYIGKLIPKDYPKKYLIPQENDNEKILDSYKNSESPIFLYSAGQNDFMTYYGSGPMELVDKSVREKLATNIAELLIKSINNVENNWKYLIEQNPSVNIFVYNVFYAPLYDIIQREIYRQDSSNNPNLEYKNIIKKSIDFFNKELLRRSNKYKNVEIIDLEFIKDHIAENDFHQNLNGNILIAEATINRIKELGLYENEKSNYK